MDPRSTGRVPGAEQGASIAKKAARGDAADSAPLQTANVEPATSYEPLATRQGAGVDKKASIHVHSKRRRLADPDGVSAKAVIDSLVLGGILRDDNAKCVEKVSYSQEACREEETIIEVTWV